MEGLQFLKKRFNLYSNQEVAKASKRTTVRTGEKVPQKPTEQIQNYLDRFKEIIEREDPKERERGLNALKKILHKKYVIKAENIPESVFSLEQRIDQEAGRGTIELTDEFREQRSEEHTSELQSH